MGTIGEVRAENFLDSIRRASQGHLIDLRDEVHFQKPSLAWRVVDIFDPHASLLGLQGEACPKNGVHAQGEVEDPKGIRCGPLMLALPHGCESGTSSGIAAAVRSATLHAQVTSTSHHEFDVHVAEVESDELQEFFLRRAGLSHVHLPQRGDDHRLGALVVFLQPHRAVELRRPGVEVAVELIALRRAGVARQKNALLQQGRVTLRFQLQQVTPDRSLRELSPTVT
mmetsp:Transcript_50879/g.146139  ORF Transcript_50879/g.146139 Transcript_50879/m.146139 type:complete len:226 (+) Transcript_50879:176-853(+)